MDIVCFVWQNGLRYKRIKWVIVSVLGIYHRLTIDFILPSSCNRCLRYKKKLLFSSPSIHILRFVCCKSALWFTTMAHSIFISYRNWNRSLRFKWFSFSIGSVHIIYIVIAVYTCNVWYIQCAYLSLSCLSRIVLLAIQRVNSNRFIPIVGCDVVAVVVDDFLLFLSFASIAALRIKSKISCLCDGSYFPCFARWNLMMRRWIISTGWYSYSFCSCYTFIRAERSPVFPLFLSFSVCVASQLVFCTRICVSAGLSKWKIVMCSFIWNGSL